MFLFVLVCSCGNSSGRIIINPVDIENYKNYNWQENFTIFPLTGNFSISSKSYSLKKGKYSMQLKAYGTPGENRLPRVLIDFGPYRLKILSVDLRPTIYKINFELPESIEGKFTFTFNDDYNSPTEDRNSFIYFPVYVKAF
jgi:hypothetical protein